MERSRRFAVVVVVAVVAFALGYVVGAGRQDTAPQSASVPRLSPEKGTEPLRAAVPRRAPLQRRLPETVAEPSVAASSGSTPHEAQRTLIRVVVRDPSGAPLAGSHVSVCASVTYEPRRRGVSWFDGRLPEYLGSVSGEIPAPAARASADGSIQAGIAEMGDGTERWVHVSATHPGYVAAVVVAERDTAQRDGVEVLLERAIRLRGRCIDQHGRPVASVQILGPRRSGATTTDANGRFSLGGIAESADYVRFLPGITPLAARCVTPPAAHDGVADFGDVILAAGGTVRGRFVDARGKPIAGAPAVLICRQLETGIVGRTTTDSDGRFVFEHAGDGTLDVCMCLPTSPIEGSDPSAFAYDVKVGDDVVVRVPSDHFVRVRWIDEDGRPVGFFGGRIAWFALDGGPERVDYSGRGSGWDHFRVPVRPGVRYELRMDLDGFDPLTQRVTGTEARDHRVDAVLRRKGR